MIKAFSPPFWGAPCLKKIAIFCRWSRHDAYESDTAISTQVLPIFRRLPKYLIILVVGLALSISPNWAFCFFEGFSTSVQPSFTLLWSPMPVLTTSVSGRFGPEHHTTAEGSILPFFAKKNEVLLGTDSLFAEKKKSLSRGARLRVVPGWIPAPSQHLDHIRSQRKKGKRRGRIAKMGKK